VKKNEKCLYGRTKFPTTQQVIQLIQFNSSAVRNSTNGQEDDSRNRRTDGDNGPDELRWQEAGTAATSTPAGQTGTNARKMRCVKCGMYLLF